MPSTKSLIEPAKNSITATAPITAATMTPSLSAMPTAVITESSEKTMSSSRIWTMTPANAAFAFVDAVVLLAPFEAVVHFERRLGDQEEAAAG